MTPHPVERPCQLHNNRHILVGRKCKSKLTISTLLLPWLRWNIGLHCGQGGEHCCSSYVRQQMPTRGCRGQCEPLKRSQKSLRLEHHRLLQCFPGEASCGERVFDRMDPDQYTYSSLCSTPLSPHIRCSDEIFKSKWNERVVLLTTLRHSSHSLSVCETLLTVCFEQSAFLKPPDVPDQI